MNQIYAETEDDHFELVIANYGIQNISVEEKLNNSAINRCQEYTTEREREERVLHCCVVAI